MKQVRILKFQDLGNYANSSTLKSNFVKVMRVRSNFLNYFKMLKSKLRLYQVILYVINTFLIKMAS